MIVEQIWCDKGIIRTFYSEKKILYVSNNYFINRNDWINCAYSNRSSNFNLSDLKWNYLPLGSKR